jgi:release factor glutamine methyltransferase
MTQTEKSDSWSIGGLLDWTSRYLAEKGAEYPRLDAEVLLAHSAGCRRIDLYTRYDTSPSEDTRARFRDLIRRRLEGSPVAYLVGRKEFFSLQFEVSSAVLIPRPESEFVVVECLRLARTMARPAVLDIGTGSGNLAVAVAARHPGAGVTAVDISAEALAVARRNAAKNGLEKRIEFVQGDLFTSLPQDAEFDFILSNPPYIATNDLDSLPVGVRDYEPRRALDGGPGGFAVFDRLVSDAYDHLTPGGQLIIEIGSPQEEQARRTISCHPGYVLAPTIYDGARHPRVLRAQKK